MTPEKVTALYSFRDEINACKNIADMARLAEKYNLTPPVEQAEFDLRKLGKALQKEFYEVRYPHADSLEEHARAIVGIGKRLHHHLSLHDSESMVLAFGSHAIGKVNSFLSDFDGLVILGRNEREPEIFKKLSDAGIVFSTHTHFEDLEQIAKTGQGLARLYGMSNDGIEVEFHVIGLQDAQQLTAVLPGYIKRVREVPAKMETRVSFTGERKAFPKPGDKVYNYFRDGDEVYRGFFTDAIIKSNIVYDPQGVAKQLFEKHLEKNVGALLIHNKALQYMHDGRFCMYGEKANFDLFLKSFFNPDRQAYSPAKLHALERQFYAAMTHIVKKFDMLVSDRIHGHLDGTNIDTATKKLHDLRVQGVEMIACDYDGTLKGGKVSHEDAAKLVSKIMEAGKIPVIITARDATIRRDFLAPLQKLVSQSLVLQDKPCYLGTANGTTLYEIRSSGIQHLYSNNLSISEIEQISMVYSRMNIKPDEDRIRGFMKGLADNWEGFIPAELLGVSARYRGVWAEQSKVTVALPQDPRGRSETVERLKLELGDKYQVAWGGQNVADVTKRLNGDNKLKALRTCMQYAGINDENLVVSFGDTPEGNDRGLLSIKNGFTNADDFQPQPGKSPTVLKGDSVDPVLRVHRAIQFVL